MFCESCFTLVFLFEFLVVIQVFSFVVDLFDDFPMFFSFLIFEFTFMNFRALIHMKFILVLEIRRRRLF